MNDFQVLGSAITYIRRYALSSALGLITDKDLDACGEQSKQESDKEPVLNVEKLNARLMACATKAELQTVYTSFTPAEKTATLKLKDQLKNTLQ